MRTWTSRCAPRGVHLNLLFLDHAFGDELVDGRLGEGSADGLACAVTLPVVGDRAGFGGDVATELAHRLRQLGLLGAGLLDVEVVLQVADRLEGSEHVAVPQEPLEALQLPSDVGRQIGLLGRAEAFGHLVHDGDRDVEPVEEVLGLGVEV